MKTKNQHKNKPITWKHNVTVVTSSLWLLLFSIFCQPVTIGSSPSLYYFALNPQTPNKSYLSSKSSSTSLTVRREQFICFRQTFCTFRQLVTVGSSLSLHLFALNPQTPNERYLSSKSLSTPLIICHAVQMFSPNTLHITNELAKQSLIFNRKNTSKYHSCPS